MMMSKNQIITLVIVVLIIIGLGFWTYKANKNVDYSVVYLTTGEIYVGKLTTFPDLELKSGYVLGTIKDTTDPAKNNFQLNPLNEALWAPQVLHLVREHVVFYGPILPTSKIAQALAAKGK